MSDTELRIAVKYMAKKKDDFTMYINACEGEEVRVAVLQNNVLDQYFIERTNNKRSHTGDIFVGKVQNVDTGLQAAFIDIGQGPHGFLSLSDIKFPRGGFEDLLRGEKKRKDKSRPEDIRQILRKGQKVVVQVTRESIPNKGPSLTTYISIPGRILVLIPQAPGKSGISRRIEDNDERKRLKTLLKKAGLSGKHGFIFRTASKGCKEGDIKNDLEYLRNMWGKIAKKIKSKRDKTPRCIYRENDLLLRIFRDVYNEKINKVFIDSREGFDRIVTFIKDIMPNKVKALQLVETAEPLFEKYNIESHIETIFKREVPLSNGGSIVIDQTEAMISIDVNSGTFHHSKGQEYVALKTNILAAEEIARQMRLRDIGGLVCIDFIDMEDPKNRLAVEKGFRQAVKLDNARVNILPLSEFGIIEMTRQRRRPNVIYVNFSKCPVCRGTGYIKSRQTLALEIFRNCKSAIARRKSKRMKINEVEVVVHPEMADYLLNNAREKISRFERQNGVAIKICSAYNVGINEIHCK